MANTGVPWARCVLVALAAVLPSTAVLPAGAGVAPVVRVQSGPLRGSAGAGVESFLNIPYAQPPTGALRWQPPQPPRPWHGVRDALAYGNRCAALATDYNGPRRETEDCLNLNVQRPADMRPGERLPVFFWIFGGGFLNGGADQYDGSLIVWTDRVVVVTINYRLGVFGYLAHPALVAGSGGGEGDYGFMDQQAALRWVHRNIAAFGGDPRRVTIGGQSAGAMSVCAHLTAPSSRGLFASAIMESGSCLSQPLASSEKAGAALATAVGCTDAATAADCLRAKSTGALLDAGGSLPSNLSVAALTSGVPVLPLPPHDAVAAGAFARIPLLLGAGRDDGRTFTEFAIGWDQAQYEAQVRNWYGSYAPQILPRYPWPAAADQFTAAYLLAAIITDGGGSASIGGCATRTLVRTAAGFTRTFAYEFDHPTGPGPSLEPQGYQWGAAHAAELAYLWPSFHYGAPVAPTFDAAERRLSTEMVRYWGAFVRTGHPAAPFSAAWPAYPAGQLTLSLRAGGRSALIPDSAVAAEHQCDFWTPGT